MFSFAKLSLGALAALATLSSAYEITVPVKNATWFSRMNEPVAWVKNGTDASNFTIVLVEGGSQIGVLAAFVNGNQVNSSELVRPTSGGFPTGNNFQIQLVQDPQNLGTIYATSEVFNILPNTTTTSSSKTVQQTATNPLTTTNGNPTSTGGFSDPTQSFSGASHNSVLTGNLILAAGALYALL